MASKKMHVHENKPNMRSCCTIWMLFNVFVCLCVCLTLVLHHNDHKYSQIQKMLDFKVGAQL